MKKFTIHLDAVVLIALVFAASLGMNAWQYLRGQELMQDYVDAAWELGNAKANVVAARTALKACNPEKYADLDVHL